MDGFTASFCQTNTDHNKDSPKSLLSKSTASTQWVKQRKQKQKEKEVADSETAADDNEDGGTLKPLRKDCGNNLVYLHVCQRLLFKPCHEKFATCGV